MEAVRAVSWLWPDSSVPYITRAAAAAASEGSRRINNASMPLRAMLPVLRERSRRRGVLMAAQSRLVVGIVGTYVRFMRSCAGYVFGINFQSIGGFEVAKV